MSTVLMLLLLVGLGSYVAWGLWVDAAVDRLRARNTEEDEP